MNRIAMKLFAVLLAFFSIYQCHAEGFAAGTLVKVSDGYKKIENVRVGDHVVCCDKEHNLVESYVTYVAQQSVSQHMRMCVGDEWISVACDQRLYDVQNNSWIAVSDLKDGDASSYDITQLCLVDKTIDVYVVGVADHHNFFVTQRDICVHNFVPVVVVAISAAFGSGAIEIAGVSAGIAGLGTFLGYKWHKNKHKHMIEMSAMTFDIVQESDNVYNANDAQAPGKPTENDGFYPPKKWDGKKVKHPRTGAVGWPDSKGNVWVPTGVGPKAHGGPHWDVQRPNGKDYDNVYPGGKIRSGK